MIPRRMIYVERENGEDRAFWVIRWFLPPLRLPRFYLENCVWLNHVSMSFPSRGSGGGEWRRKFTNTPGELVIDHELFFCESNSSTKTTRIKNTRKSTHFGIEKQTNKRIRFGRCGYEIECCFVEESRFFSRANSMT